MGATPSHLFPVSIRVPILQANGPQAKAMDHTDTKQFTASSPASKRDPRVRLLCPPPHLLPSHPILSTFMS